MADKFIYIIYLHPDVKDERWAFLHRFFHPGIREHDKKTALMCFSLDTSHHVFLMLKVRDFSTDKNKKIYVPYTIVDSIIELAAPKSQLGFLHLKESFDKLEQEERTSKIS